YACRGEHPGKPLFRRRRFKGSSIEQQLIARDGQQQSRLVFGTKRGTQFAPRRFVLSGSARMPEIIHPGELKQYVEAANKGARGCGPHMDIIGHLDLGSLPSKYEVRGQNRQWYECPVWY